MSDMIFHLATAAASAAKVLSATSEKTLNAVLEDLAKLMIEDAEALLAANQTDLRAARKNGKPEAFLDRLSLSMERLKGIIDGVRTVKSLKDPVGEIIQETERPNGLLIRRVRVPLGVIGMIYESRPNVTIDAACLCLKSHNAVILRGGSEALQTNKEFHRLIERALEKNNLPKDCVCLVPSSDRALVDDMLQAVGLIDVIIPRGGKSLTDKVIKNSKIPVFSHLDGICHVYVHPSAKPDIARKVVLNAKMRRTGICGAAETLLLDKAVAQPLKKDIINLLLKSGCEVRGDEVVQALDTRVLPATEDDWKTEYLAPIISIKVVETLEDAIAHVNTYGSHHTDSIMAEDQKAVDTFLTAVDSGIVMHNASTQFADGGEFGMGAEIGIATGKLHARGPVGLEQLTTYKYHVLGTGQIREP
ncbi:MAG: glutamate-5-semialdehyde dehydrogenase [Rhodospirillales bacterium]|nr:glutamate-5-semialdehyde dehydrogenase [Rhodospirillales bacterium]MCB9964920.1 glutamate-5-semialdehyde dehydrogenase [Rhodospirillales bacterium]MCB9973714.1 glutamate-5-semialdehyde dehydrogenase [Rhodospirillales bacterium]